TISALRLGHFCKTCVGIYASSTLLAIAGIAAWLLCRSDPGPPIPADKTLIDPDPYGASRDDKDAVAARAAAPPPRRAGRPSDGHWIYVPVWALALGLFAIT